MNAVWPAIVNGAILSVLPAVAVWMVLRVTPRSLLNASARYLIWWIALAVIVALPLLYTPAQSFSQPAASPNSTAALRVMEIGDGTRGAGAGVTPKHAGAISTVELPRWLPALWMLVSSLLLARLILSYRSLQRKSARSNDVPAEWRGRAAEWLERVGGSRAGVRLAVSTEIAIPVAAGPRQPSILIPEMVFEELALDEMDQIGLHEAAHLARRDDWTLIAQRAVEALFALHPVVRFVSRQIDLEREIACDDRVVEATGRPVAYAACLAHLVELCATGRAPLAVANAAGTRSHLTQRVELLVDQERDIADRVGASRVFPFAAALLVLTCLLAKAPLPVALAMQPLEAAPAAGASDSIIGKLSQPHGEQPPIALYFDLTAMSKDAQVQALDGSKRYLRGAVPNRTMAAILTFDGKTVVVRQDFTADMSQLEHTLDQVSANTADILPVSESARVSALQSIVSKLKTLSGDKDLVFFVCLPIVMDQDQLDTTLDMAAKAKVSYFTIDFRGARLQPFRN